MSDSGHGPRKRRKVSPPEPGPYVLRSVLEDIQLKPDDGPDDVYITCVEYWSKCDCGLLRGRILTYRR